MPSDFELIDSLTTEVVDIVCHPHFFATQEAISSDDVMVISNGELIRLAPSTIEEFFTDVDCCDDHSPRTAYSTRLRETSTWPELLRQFDTIDSFSGVSAQLARIDDCIRRSSHISRVIARLAQAGTMPYDEVAESVYTLIGTTSESIINTRVIFLSKRFSLMEAAFAALRKGYLPFGLTDSYELVIHCV